MHWSVADSQPVIDGRTTTLDGIGIRVAAVGTPAEFLVRQVSSTAAVTSPRRAVEYLPLLDAALAVRRVADAGNQVSTVLIIEDNKSRISGIDMRKQVFRASSSVHGDSGVTLEARNDTIKPDALVSKLDFFADLLIVGRIVDSV